jgi:DNA-binding CsgD family transcriptional regulator
MLLFKRRDVNSDTVAVPSIILESIFDAAGDATRWSSALAQIAEWVNAAGATYFLLEGEPNVPRVGAIYSSGFTPIAELAYHDTGCAIDPHIRIGANTPLQTWFFSEEHFDCNFISRDAFFQEVMNSLGIRWIAGSRLWDIEQNVACLAIQKPIEVSGFSDAERSRLTALTPHLGRATRLQKKLSTLALKADMGIEAMNKLSCGIALLDARRCVLFSNTNADCLLRQDSIFKPLSASQIAIRHAKSNEALRSAVADAFRHRSTALQLHDRDGKPAISAAVLPLPARSEWNAMWQRPLALLAMNELFGPESISSYSLSQLFGLTPTESKVANWLVTGGSIEEYAERRGVSIETARSQLKSILSKTGMRRQAQLVASLLRLPIQQFVVDNSHGTVD